jgi:hypothetical protein
MVADPASLRLFVDESLMGVGKALAYARKGEPPRLEDADRDRWVLALEVASNALLEERHGLGRDPGRRRRRPTSSERGRDPP